MNKKILSLIFLLFTFFQINKSMAQCTPNPTNTALITPDTITNLSPGTVSAPYSQIIYVHPPIDSTVTIGAIPIHLNPVDSIVLNGIGNLPPGLSYACVPASCVFPGATSGCIAITGTPTTAGMYPLTIDITAYGKEATTGFALFYPFSITAYRININITGVAELSQNSNFQLLDFGPDPVQEHLSFKMNSPVNTTADFSVFNILGKNVYSQPASLKKGINTIELNTKNLAAGVYILTLKKDPYVLLRRFVIGGK
ncbi:MAG: T9SS type A sorting domain-containing protein [Bacteroidia bacterium]